MPLRGNEHTAHVNDTNLYFTSLAELDDWADAPSEKRTGILAYKRRLASSDVTATVSKGTLLVCHDYKGGYSESPSRLSYTFNFWPYCDMFIYFAHHRVTVPPAGWTTAAHRQGVKILGTLIFEGSGEADCLRLLIGRLPQAPTGPARSSTTSLPVSPHYARILAHLARQRGFDGYLLNVECPLQGGIEQTRALCAWIALLESELKQLVGDHAQVVWYDSVTIDGQLRWQDRLNSLNLPFFLPSSSFFTNYTWQPHFPSLTAQYFLSIDPKNLPRPKSLKDIYVGVDVWGRGQHGGGGLACYKAIDHIDPQFLGLSVALFGHAWTWETLEDRPDFTWDKWWAHERMLWVGPEVLPTKDVAVPDPPPNQVADDHGPFKPVAAFFNRLPPPNPKDLTFFTSFSPGVGKSWFVGGLEVLRTEHGWTDVEKTGSIGDMLWPRPTLAWEHDGCHESLPLARSSIYMEDAWLGGSSVYLSLQFSGPEAADSFRCLWIPIQSLTFTPCTSYNMTLVYKIPLENATKIEFDIGLDVKAPPNCIDEIQITPIVPQCCEELLGGWRTLSIEAFIPSSPSLEISVISGLVVGLAMEGSSRPADFSLILGSLSVYASPSSSLCEAQPKILWADFRKDASLISLTSNFSGVLTWGVGEHLVPLSGINIVSPEDPQPAWATNLPCPTFAYFNIYVLIHSPKALTPGDAVFIGTTGLDGRRERFYVDHACLPADVNAAAAVRFYVQGITDRGEVLPWEHCTFVDVEA